MPRSLDSYVGNTALFTRTWKKTLNIFFFHRTLVVFIFITYILFNSVESLLVYSPSLYIQDICLISKLRNYRVISAHASKRRLWNDLWQRYQTSLYYISERGEGQSAPLVFVCAFVLHGRIFFSLLLLARNAGWLLMASGGMIASYFDSFIYDVFKKEKKTYF